MDAPCRARAVAPCAPPTSNDGGRNRPHASSLRILRQILLSDADSPIGVPSATSLQLGAEGRWPTLRACGRGRGTQWPLHQRHSTSTVRQHSSAQGGLRQLDRGVPPYPLPWPADGIPKWNQLRAPPRTHQAYL
eukprot:scaffold168380_cov45-Tisochrysis_lutea.AAC.1